MRDIVHIGYPRTASTWFQQSFFPKVQNYTIVPRKTVQDNFIHPLPGYYDANWNKHFRQNDTPLLISEEMITGKIRAGAVNLHFLEIYSHRLKESLNDPILVIFLRRQPDILFSFYNLYIKKGGTFSISNFLRQDLHMQEFLLCSMSFILYDIALQVLMKTFSKEAIKIYLYEDFHANPYSFLDRFAYELDLDVNWVGLNHLKSNPSYTPAKLKAKRLMNRFTNEGVPFKQYFLNLPYTYNLFREGYAQETKLPAKFLRQIDKYRDSFAKSNNKVLLDFNLIEMRKFNYPL
jgi:hypothetical protein